MKEKAKNKHIADDNLQSPIMFMSRYQECLRRLNTDQEHLDQMIGDRLTKISEHQDKYEYQLDCYSHLKRIVRSKVLVFLSLNKALSASVVESRVLPTSFK